MEQFMCAGLYLVAAAASLAISRPHSSHQNQRLKLNRGNGATGNRILERQWVLECLGLIWHTCIYGNLKFWLTSMIFFLSYFLPHYLSFFSLSLSLSLPLSLSLLLADASTVADWRKVGRAKKWSNRNRCSRVGQAKLGNEGLPARYQQRREVTRSNRFRLPLRRGGPAWNQTHTHTHSHSHTQKRNSIRNNESVDQWRRL